MSSAKKLTQWGQCQNSWLARFYWDIRDKHIFKNIMGKKIIDLGCGEGITLQKIKKLFPHLEIIGIDNDIGKVKICQKYSLPVKLADVTDLPFKSNSFDCGLLIEVIEHLNKKDVSSALKEISRVLKPGGRLLVLFPNDGNFMIARLAFLKFKEAFYNYEHLRQWIPAESRFFEKFGFKIKRQQSIPLPWWRLCLHHLVVLEKK